MTAAVAALDRRTIAHKARAAAGLARQAGGELAARKVRDFIWGERTYYALRCDLSRLPPRRRAAIELTMTARDCRTCDAFDDEQREVRGTDYLEVVLRQWWRETGIEELFIADGPGSRPAYCQWLLQPSDQWKMHAFAPGRYPVLRSDEVMLEGAYTFTAFRRKGVMADGMWQLLARARAEGARFAITYVGEENLASLRGCAAVGFRLDHRSRNIRRVGLHRSVLLPPDGDAHRQWARASKGRPPVPAEVGRGEVPSRETSAA